MKENKKVVYYNDLLNDDFAGTRIKEKPFPKKYKYIHKKNFLWNLTAFLVYFIVAVPVLWITGKIMSGVKVKGRKNLKKLRKTGYFVYGNHTQITDAWLVQAYMLRFRRGYIFADKDAISIPGIRGLVTMLGCLAMPDVEHGEDFIEAIKYHYNKKHVLVVYPERHIWPYYTHIRPFPDDSFIYPASLGAPVVPICINYRQRKFRKNASPRMTVYVGKPIYPDLNKSLPERKKILRDKTYEFMLDKSSEEENIEHIIYIQKKKEE